MRVRGKSVRIAIVVGRFNQPVTKRLLAGAQERLTALGVPASRQEAHWVAGAFEIPQATAWLVARKRKRPACAAHEKLRGGAAGRPDAVVALGCIVQGETYHHDYLARAVIGRLLALGVESGIPIGLGVVTTKTSAQALARAGGSRGNRGADAAQAALQMLRLKQEMP